ncbi:conserved hypothetical protein [Salmonella enterica subsp. enterica serovar Virchow str. SL491]|uniref:Uncharacterized protein n=1 Tax=Salmonella virchow (strain SL491) TaxID=465517 RepID=A0A6C8EVI0_SALV4|nr:conserved hypothetical protein [Salmonella enterica subsp. enterica serovar Virchow str. SL491]
MPGATLMSPTAMPCYLQRVKRVFRLKCRGRSLMRCATISSWTDTLTMTNRTQWPVFLCLRGVCCVK